MWSDDAGEIYAGSEHPEGALAAFALNALDDAEFQSVFHHVIRCLHCQEVLLGFQETAARLTASAPEVELPSGLKQRVLANSVGRRGPSGTARRIDADPRWSVKRLRRWITPLAVGALSLLLAASVGFMISQHREIRNLTAGQQSAVMASAVESSGQPATGEASARQVVAEADADASIGQAIPVSRTRDSLNLSRNVGQFADGEARAAEASESVDLVKQGMADMVEATVLSAQPETEKLSMTSPMGTETEARGLLMVDPTGTHAVLMVTGMPADSYQIWLLRHDARQLIDRIVVNENDGSGVKDLELDQSMFGFHEVALLPDERHGPMAPTGEKFLSARIIGGPPVPPSIWRGR
ncbi:MAG: hypothetical protein OXF79_09295 [Chloroflexi bacterium]|nr:hypothetical protein [Chloroflexota bacterium]